MPKKFIQMKKAGEKIAALTAYDATFAHIEQEGGVDIILVGDSLGMVFQGKNNTLSVRPDDIIYHIKAVARGTQQAFIIGDMPFASFEQSPVHAFDTAARLLMAGASMVKIEGSAQMAKTIEFLTTRGVPVCAHVGLLPQQIKISGNYRVQGRDRVNAERIYNDAIALEKAGACLIVLELLPRRLAQKISQTLRIPTIGIGSGPDCDGQILVIYDILGLTSGKKRFVKNFLIDCDSIPTAITAYVNAVKQHQFPTIDHSFE